MMRSFPARSIFRSRSVEKEKMHKYLKNKRLPLLFVLLAVTAAGLQSAQARPSTSSYTCEKLRDYIVDRGAVVMNTKGRHVYDRFVVHSGFCDNSQIARRISVPASDGICRIRHCVGRHKSRSSGGGMYGGGFR